MSGEWRQQWEDQADQERRRFDRKSVDALLKLVRSRQFGDYHIIRYSIGERGHLEQAAWELFEVLLDRRIDFLPRYHCAAALLSLMKYDGFEPVQLSSENHGMEENLQSLRRLLEDRLGPQPKSW